MNNPLSETFEKMQFLAKLAVQSKNVVWPSCSSSEYMSYCRGKKEVIQPSLTLKIA